jgi:hypothetical protein
MENETKKRKRQKHSDRVLLSPEALARLQDFDSQIEAAFGQTVSVGHKDKITFFFRQRGFGFTAAELEQIRELYFDEVKAVQLALKELKVARANGDRAKVDEVMKKLAAPHVTQKDTPNRPRVRRSKKGSSAVTDGTSIDSRDAAQA